MLVRTALASTVVSVLALGSSLGPSLVTSLGGAPAAPAAAPAPDVTLSGKECRIKTDLKPRLAKDVPKQIDRYCANFAGFYDGLGLKARSSNKVVIRLFARYEDYEEFYQRSSPGEDPPAAYYSPSLNGVVAYHDPEDPYLRQVLFHETSHQYLNRYTSHAPKWTNEGLAEYFEGWQLEADGTLIKRRPPFYDLLVIQQALEDNLYLQPKELIQMPAMRFMSYREYYPELHGYLHYATAWALTWYFLEGPNEEDRARYLRFLEGLCEDGSRAEPFAPKDWDGWADFEERWKAFISSIEVVPETADDHVILAANLRGEREYKAAVEHYEKALQLDPDTPDVHYWLGYCYKRRGRYEEARPWLLKAMEADEDDARAPYLLARIWSGMDKDETEVDAERALELAKIASKRLDDKSPTHLSFVAVCQSLNGDDKGSAKTMKKVLRLVKDADDSVREYYEGLAEALAE